MATTCKANFNFCSTQFWHPNFHQQKDFFYDNYLKTAFFYYLYFFFIQLYAGNLFYFLLTLITEIFERVVNFSCLFVFAIYKQKTRQYSKTNLKKNVIKIHSFKCTQIVLHIYAWYTKCIDASA